MDLNLVYFVYGLAFFTMSLVVWIRIRPLMDNRLARTFGWLVAFGMAHAIHDWIEMFVVMGHSGSGTAVLFISTLSVALSFAALLQFGIEVIGINKNLTMRIRLVPAILCILWFFFYLKALSYEEGAKLAEIWSRYTMGFPGAFLTAYALIRRRKEIAESSHISKNFFMAGVVFVFYGVLTVIVHETDFFPAAILNYLWFTDLVGLPVQLFRALLIIAITYFIIRSMDVFDVLEKRMLADQVREMTKSLEESEEKYRTLFELAGDAFLTVVPPWGKILDANEETVQMLGYTKEEIKGLCVRDIIAPEVVEETDHEWRTQVKEKGNFLLETIWVRKDGSQFPVEVSGKPLELQGQALYQLIGRDITERKEAEKLLKRLERRYRELVEGLDAIVWEADAQTWQFTFVSKRAEAILGYPVNQWLNEPNFWANHIHANDRDEAVSFCQLATQEGRDHVFEYRMKAADGSTVWLRDTVTVDGAEGKPVRLKGVMIDITPLKRAEEEKEKIQAQLRQAQKMEAIGRLAGGIAHDFNNILSPILGYTDMALEDIPQDSRARTDLEHVIKAAKRAKALVQQILIFSRQDEQERKPVQIHLIIREALKLLQASLPSNIEIRQNIDTESGAVLADPTQIHQVIMNLCTNAYHAMRESGGVMTISLAKVEVDIKFVKQHPNLHEGQYIRLSVSDTGHGMDQATMERIFDPFFTTKGMGEGTGLGLSVVHGIVSSHDGEITVYSEPGKGSTFHVYLPRADGDVEQEVSRDEPIPKGKERVLFVDDEKEIAVMAKEMLERFGYKVTLKTSSIEALKAFRTHPNKFDIIITDQTMPHMTGTQLAKELMNIRTDIPIILTTGFSEMITPEKAKEMGIREYIMKPIVARDLGKIIREVLDKEK